MKLFQITLLVTLLLSLNSCAMDDPKNSNDTSKEDYKWEDDPTLTMDQGYLDPDSGEFVPARMEESEEARKKRLAEEENEEKDD